jgi:beta-lactamase class D
LYKEQLPFDVVYQRIAKRILPGDSSATWRIQGKTGWAVRADKEYGWYVGWVEHAGRTAYFAINIDMHSDLDARKRQELTRMILVKEGWLDKDAL